MELRSNSRNHQVRMNGQKKGTHHDGSSCTGERVINGIFEDATETSPGYFPMVLLHIDKSWKRGGEAKWYEPNGEYDYFMREQNGFLTPHMGYTGGRCHDE